MHVLHEREQPELGIFRGLFQAGETRTCTLCTDGVCEDAAVGELALLGLQPLGPERVVGQDKDGSESDHAGNRALEDEEPGEV